MTDLEKQAENAALNVEEAALELQQAELELSHGNKFMDEAREKFGKLKIAVETKRIGLRRAKLWHEKAKEDAAKGFAEDNT